MMNISRQLLMGCALVFHVSVSTAAFAASPESAGGEQREYFGTVIAVASDQFRIEHEGETQAFFVDPDAIVLVNGVHATLADVRPGYFAAVSASYSREGTTAEFVRATIQY